jgi:hypothetical protein
VGEQGEERREEEGTWYHEGPDSLRIGKTFSKVVFYLQLIAKGPLFRD